LANVAPFKASTLPIWAPRRSISQFAVAPRKQRLLVADRSLPIKRRAHVLSECHAVQAKLAANVGVKDGHAPFTLVWLKIALLVDRRSPVNVGPISLSSLAPATIRAQQMRASLSRRSLKRLSLK
jgi:hypothetical protein